MDRSIERKSKLAKRVIQTFDLKNNNKKISAHMAERLLESLKNGHKPITKIASFALLQISIKNGGAQEETKLGLKNFRCQKKNDSIIKRGNELLAAIEKVL